MCFEFGKVFEKYVQNAFCIRSNVCEICSEYILWVFFVNENGQSQKAHLPLLLPFVTKIKNSFSENGFWNGKPKHSKCEKQKMKRQKVGKYPLSDVLVGLLKFIQSRPNFDFIFFYLE